MAPSPTQRSMNRCRQLGYVVTKTEYWDHFSRRRRDLFGFCDVLAITPHRLLAIQATSESNMSARIDKTMGLETAQAWLSAGERIEVWGWGWDDCHEEWQLHVSKLQLEHPEA